MDKYKRLFGSWFSFFEEFMIKTEYFKNLISFINGQYYLNEIFPAKNKIFRCFQETDYNNLKVVILGDEPYPDARSNGLAFGITEEVGQEPPAPLRHMRDCIESSEKDGLYFMDYSLESWAKQGVLLLNTTLTSIKNRPHDHSLLWRMFIKYTLVFLTRNKPGTIYVLLGNRAKTYKKYIGKFNYVLEYDYPDEKTKNWDVNLFTTVNKIIKDNNGEEFSIDW